jgi:hypothetical protein
MTAYMQNEKIDIEKDFLVVHRDRQGLFRYFRWYSGDKAPRDHVEGLIAKWNQEQEKKEDGYPAELITDKLVREICAYREHAEKFEELIKDAKDVQESIDKAKEYLENALEYINDIGGLDEKWRLRGLYRSYRRGSQRKRHDRSVRTNEG